MFTGSKAFLMSKAIIIMRYYDWVGANIDLAVFVCG